MSKNINNTAIGSSNQNINNSLAPLYNFTNNDTMDVCYTQGSLIVGKTTKGSPSYTVDVSGNLNFSGNLYKSGVVVSGLTPRFDSGWFAISTANNTVGVDLNLTFDITLPFQHKVFLSDNSNPVIGTNNISDITGMCVNTSQLDGYHLYINAIRKLRIRTGTSDIGCYANITTGVLTYPTSGYYRVFIY